MRLEIYFNGRLNTESPPGYLTRPNLINSESISRIPTFEAHSRLFFFAAISAG